MTNHYEVTGNQIKVYLDESATRGWNQITDPQIRNMNEIQEWCRSASNETICYWDALNQNAVSTTDSTKFLYKWISWYIGEPINGTAAEFERLPQDLRSFDTGLTQDLAYLFLKFIKHTADITLDCIFFVLNECMYFNIF